MFGRLVLYSLTLLYLILLLLILLTVRYKSEVPNVTDDGGLNSYLLKTNTGKLLDLELLKFNDYVIRHNKTYSAQEYKIRLKNFKASLSEIARLNAHEHNADFGLTKFADMSEQEFADQMLMPRKHGSCVSYTKSCLKKHCLDDISSISPSTIYTHALPDEIDWREKGVIGPVQDQKLCRGCWAFSMAGVIESMAKIKNISTQTLSVQEIIDCFVDNNNGCKGGNVASALRLLCCDQLNVVSAESYPLTLRTEKCKPRNKNTGVKVKSFKYKCSHDEFHKSEHNIQRALMNGPVTAVVNAAIWRYYLKGVIQRSCFRSDSSYDHVIQIVGFNRKAKVPYYIIKNSWGEAFGEHGYLKLEMNKNMCGIAEEVGIIDVY